MSFLTRQDRTLKFAGPDWTRTYIFKTFYLGPNRETKKNLENFFENNFWKTNFEIKILKKKIWIFFSIFKSSVREGNRPVEPYYPCEHFVCALLHFSGMLSSSSKNGHPFISNLLFRPKIQQTKMLVTCQRFGDLFLFGLVWQYSTNQNQHNKGAFTNYVCTWGG